MDDSELAAVEASISDLGSDCRLPGDWELEQFARLVQALRGERERASQLADALTGAVIAMECAEWGDDSPELNHARSVLAGVVPQKPTVQWPVTYSRGSKAYASLGVVSSTQRFQPMEDADFSLVTFDAAGKPSCLKHGAMNKMTESPPGVWRCITTNAGGYTGDTRIGKQTGGCRAGCMDLVAESVSSSAAKEAE